MKKSAYLCGGSALVMALSIGLGAAAYAAEAPAEVSEVVVTGSLIKGTPEDAALPVDVIGMDELQRSGSPTTLELIKSLTVSNGVLGDTNQFDARAQGSEGSGSVNLRGLGAQRTLVLLNGHRMTVNPFGQAGTGIVDTNILPSAAIGRVEVLKDGAAATYGSDAIGGVVNFITRTNFRGLEVGGSYKMIEGSDGDYTANAVWGWGGDNFDILLTGGLQHRSTLSIRERDWANQPYLANPEGGWSAAGNPGSILAANFSSLYRDPGCVGLGGTPGYSGVSPVCQWHYTPFDNLTEKEDRYQLYGQINADLSENNKLHVEVLVSHTEVPEWLTSPSYAALSNPTAAGSGVAGRYFVPGTSPGLIDFVATFPTATNAINPITGATIGTVPTAGLLATGAFLAAFRPFGLGGNPAFGFGSSRGERTFDAFRVQGDLTGKFDFLGGVDWTWSMGYSQEVGERTGYDTLVDRYALALRGLGGAGCNPTTGVPGVGPCSYFNPFSPAILSNAITGVANPVYHSAVSNNNTALINWFFVELSTKQTTKLFTTEFVTSGTTGITLGGGDLAWALGAQYRKDFFTARYNDISNRAVNPCIDTPINGNTACTIKNGPFMFLGVGTEADLSNDVWATFGELSLPFTDNFQVQLAARYEDYGGAIGSTFNPKISARWQIVDAFAIRGSAGSTFRGPPTVSLNSDFVTSLQSILGTFRAVDIYGNANLEPEKAKTYSVGAIFSAGGLKATVDWWRFDFDNPITTDPVAGIVTAVFGTGSVPNCASPLIGRFTFNNGPCTGATTATNISRLRTNTVNGAAVRTSGIDVLADYKFDALGGQLGFGGSLTYVLEYKIGQTFVDGVAIAGSAFDAVGLLNYQTVATPLPQWKAQLHAEYTNGPHNLRLTMNYIDGYTDQRLAPFATNAYAIYNPGTDTKVFSTISAGKNIDSFMTWDIDYRVFLPWDTTVVASVDNLTDEDPPLARLDLNYDPFTASALGRMVKISVTKKF